MTDDRKTIFSFKKFSLSNWRSPMKVGTDGVLLGAWAGRECASKCPRRVLDVGTGTGVIALMMAQHFDNTLIDAVDISPEAFDEARENFGNSQWSARLRAFHGDFLALKEGVSYDLIVSNPPFFAEKVRCTDAARERARRDEALPLSRLVSHASKLLAPEGNLALILPSNRIGDLEETAAFAGLSVVILTKVSSRADKDASRMMVLLSKISQPRRVSQLAIRDSSGNFTDDYRRLLKDFYLEF